MLEKGYLLLAVVVAMSIAKHRAGQGFECVMEICVVHARFRMNVIGTRWVVTRPLVNSKRLVVPNCPIKIFLKNNFFLIYTLHSTLTQESRFNPKKVQSDVTGSVLNRALVHFNKTDGPVQICIYQLPNSNNK